MNTQLLFPLLVVLLIVPLLLSSRRQKKAQAQAQELQSSLTEGDVVTTTSGMRGTVHDASYEDTIDLEIAPGVVTTWLRAAVRDKVTDTTGEHSAETIDSGADRADDELDANPAETQSSTEGTAQSPVSVDSPPTAASPPADGAASDGSASGSTSGRSPA